MKKITFLFLALLLSFGLFSQETAITNLVLVNADTNADIIEISEGMEINLQEYPGVAFSIRAIAESNVQSVRLQLDGPVSGAMTENVAPYALFGDVSGNFNGKTFLPGAYVMQAMPYNAPNLGGVAGEELAINFSVVDEDLQRPFITTWKTDNPGDSPDNQITIPTFPGEGYDYNIAWGDGSSNSGVTGDITHNYQTPGTYQVSISGNFPRIQFPNSTDHQKIISIDQWGAIEWKSMDAAFATCINLEVRASDTPDFSNVTSLQSMFGMCSSMSGNESFGRWDVSNIESMANMFEHSVFNQNISGWDVSNVNNMRGMFFSTPFNNDIGSWNVSNVSDMGDMFYSTAFNKDIGDWDVSSVSKMERMFFEAFAFNQDISGWNTNNVTNMARMFGFADSFDQNLGAWNVTTVSEMQIMFQESGLSVENYDSTLIGWSSQQLQNEVTFGGGNSQFCQGEAARQKLIDDFGWAITDAGKAADCTDTTSFITTWKTDNPGESDDNQITIPTFDGEVYDYTVNWGDGTSDSAIIGAITHTYASPGTYQVSISGVYPRIYFNGGFEGERDSFKIVSVDQWGSTKWTSMENAFVNCRNLDVVALDIPDLSNVLSMRSMFGFCLTLQGTPGFNDWNVSSVTDMNAMFFDAAAFNQDISAWNVGSVTDMRTMFKGLESFNIDIGSWDVSSVTDMSSMFSGAKSFNQDISSWNVSSVTTMAGMFSSNTVFNRPIDSWDVSSVTDMSFMFSFNNEFNQDVSGWDVSSVENMGAMFQQTTSFNHDITAWDVGNVTNMSFMFNMASSFNQNLGLWNVGKVTEMEIMFGNVGLSTDNYDSTLAGWSTQQLQNGVTFDAGNSQFCLGEAARQKLIDDYGWTINDGGKAEDCTEPRPFIFSLTKENSFFENITIPVNDGEIYDYTVDWGDGNIDANLTGPASHSYSQPNQEYRIEISGLFPRIYFGQLVPIEELDATLTIYQWGDQKWSSFEDAFGLEETKILILAEDAPNLNETTSLQGMFSNTFDVDGIASMHTWDVSTIEDMSFMFWRSIQVNADISGWDVSNVKNMSHMFSDSKFNQNIANWNVGNVTDMSAMFMHSSINQNIGNWDVSNVTNMSSMFFLTPFNQDISNWNVENVTDMTSMFSGASLFNQDISDWNVNKVTSMKEMFFGAEDFSQNLGTWNISKLEDAENFLSDTGLSTENYDATLIGWSNLSQLPSDLSFGARGVQYCLGETARQKLINDFGWTITDGGSAEACDTSVEGEADLLAATYLQGARNPEPTGPIMRVEEGNRETYLKFDLSGFTGDITEAQLEMVVASDPGHGTLEVFLGSNSNWTETGLNGSNKPNIVGGALASISGTHSLGQTKLWNLDVSQLSGAGEITLIVKHSNGNDVAFGSDESNLAPKLFITSQVVPDLPRPFITTWKTDNPGISGDNQITLPINIFTNPLFTVDWGDGTSDIDISETITHTYDSAGTYSISIAGSFKGFDFASESDKLKIISVNQWGNVEWGGVAPRFAGCSNLDILATDIPDFSNVTSMDRMFMDCINLIGNSSMNDWDVSRVVEMELVFAGATSFNQDISGWNVGSVNDMNQMFSEAAAFNHDLSSWNVSNVLNMSRMFYRASSFNRDISQWDVANLFNANSMFEGAISFNQNLGAWNISNLQGADKMFNGTGLSIENYDSTLIGWSILDTSNGETQIWQNLVFGAGNAQYCIGEAARQKLIDDFGWIITDGGRSLDCNPVVSGDADLIDATYLQGSRNPEPTGPILRIEEGNRETYMKFDLSGFPGDITEAQLEMVVSSDPGNGTLEVFLGSDSNWTETGLNGSNKPSIIGATLASISGTHSLGQTKIWNLDVSQIPSGGLITLIVKHSNGNDVAFASDETANAPKLIISSVGAVTNNTNSLNLSPNPASDEIVVGFDIPIQVGAVFVYDVSGKLVQAMPAGTAKVQGDYPMDVSTLPDGMYFLRTFDADGIPHQKTMVIDH